MLKTGIPLKTIIANHTFRHFTKLRFVEDFLLAAYEKFPCRFILQLFPDYRAYKTPSLRSCLRHGIRFEEIDIATITGWQLYYFHSSNIFASEHVHPGEVIFDIGGHHGETALFFAKAVGDKGKVYVFEPLPFMYERMVKNFAGNPHLNCIATCMALGKENGVAKMRFLDNTNPGTTSIDSSYFTTGRTTPPVEIASLDNYVETHKIEHIDFIKIDVEGYELDVLEGARTSIARWNPRMLIELYDKHQKMHGHKASDVIRWLETNGYQIWDSSTRNPISSNDNLADCKFDILCKPK